MLNDRLSAAKLSPGRLLVWLGAVIVIIAVAAGLFGWHEYRGDGRMVLPRRVDGLVLDDGTGIQSGAEPVREILRRSAPMATTIGAVYADTSGAPRSVVFAAGTGALSAPRLVLGRAFTLVMGEYTGIHAVEDVTPGPLGGVMRCGAGQAEGTSTIVVCGWADHASLGMAIFPNRAVAQSAGLLRAMRVATRSDTAGGLAGAGPHPGHVPG